MWINEAKTELVWWDREANSEYMSFTVAANNMLHGTAAADLCFLDGKLFVAFSSGHGVQIVDFLRDDQQYLHTDGQFRYKGNIKERNDTLVPIRYSSSPAIVNSTCNSIAAVRDPALVDEFGRPQHWWATGTQGGVSVYSPVANAIYDSG